MLASRANHLTLARQLRRVQESTCVCSFITLQQTLQLTRLARVDQTPQLLSLRDGQLQTRRDAVEDLDVVNCDAITVSQPEPQQDLRRKPQHFEIRVVSAAANQLATELRVLASPLRVRLWLLPEHRRRVTEAQRARPFGKQRRGHARD